MGKPTTFSDGTECTLRHAPRKKKGSGEKLPVPMTPAIAPKHWTNPQMGESKKPPPEEPVPDFNKWHKTKQLEEKKAARTPARRTTTPSFTPGFSAQLASPQTPGLPPMKSDASHPGDVTPFLGVTGDLLPGGQTPVMHGANGTPGMLPDGAPAPRVGVNFTNG